MQQVRIKENSWLARIAAGRLGAVRVAMVIGKTIHLFNTTAGEFMAESNWVCHELKHVEQYERHGVAGFLWRYLWETIRKGYFNNRFEVEARAAETDRTLLLKYEIKYHSLK
jgi:hypothetical protein